MEELLNKLDEACTQYLEEKLDDAGFRAMIDEIPAELWQDKDSAMEIIRALVENEDLYEASLEKRVIFSKFICHLLPQGFLDKADNVLGVAGIIIDFFADFDEGVGAGDLDGVFSSAPQTLWEDERFAVAAANMVIDHAYSMGDLNCISEVIPDSVWKTEDDLVWLVRRFYNEDERNMNCLSLFPQKSWESAKVIFEILSCLESALENDRGWGTVYCNFRGSNESYLDIFLSYVPERFKSNKDFVEELLSYDYFKEAFPKVYDWMDQSIWADKEFVMAVLETDITAILKVPQELASDEEFRAYVEENIDLEWELKYMPQDKIPQWIKDWNK